MELQHAPIVSKRIASIAANHRLLLRFVLALATLGILVGLDALLWQGSSTSPADERSTVNLLKEVGANWVQIARAILLGVFIGTWIVALGLLREVRPDIGFLYGCLVAVLLLVFPFNLAILWSIDRDARKILREEGVDVGLMGAKGMSPPS